MTQHIEAYCDIKGCNESAAAWVDFGKTFYLCQTHRFNLENEHGMYGHLDIFNRKIVEVEIAIYSCSEDCEVCN